MGTVSDWLGFIFDFSSVRAAIVRISLAVIIAIIVVLFVRVVLGKRSRPIDDEGNRAVVPVDQSGAVVPYATGKAGPNQSPPFPDEALEGRRLERVLFGAFLMAVGIAIAVPIYFLREPTRTAAETNSFYEASVKRGEMLFSSPGMPAFDSAESLQCANCHGAKGEGGSVQTVIQPQFPGDVAHQVSWYAPALNSVLLRFPRDDQGQTQVTQIITYGRPGTPMQAWGVDGGGAKGEQSIDDLVNYLQSIQISPAKAKAESTAELKNPEPGLAHMSETQPEANLQAQCQALYNAHVAVANVLNQIVDPKAEDVPGATDKNTCDDVTQSEQLQDQAQTAFDAAGITPNANDQRAIDLAKATVPTAEAAVADARKWIAERDALKVRDAAAAQKLYETDLATAHQAIADSEAALAKAEASTAIDKGDKVSTAKETLRTDKKALAALEKQGPVDLYQGRLLFENNCARCHTDGWSTFDPSTPYAAPQPGPMGGGAFGPNLTDGSEVRQFPTLVSQVTFVQAGSQYQKQYGVRGIGSGRMPGFFNVLKPEQIEAIVQFERSL